MRLEEAEAFAQKEGKRLIAKLQAKLRDVEAELEAEQRRSRDLQAENRKLSKMLQELRQQCEDDHRAATELADQVSTLQLRIKTLRRQLDEAEEVVNITMNKYRKAQQAQDDAERRADVAERNITVVRTGGPLGRHGGTRSMSVTREVTKVVRV